MSAIFHTFYYIFMSILKHFSCWNQQGVGKQ